MKPSKDIKLQPKWFVVTALLFIAVLGGVLGQQKSVVPNQEIVVQFANEKISLSDANQTIAIVEQELQDIGASHIRISEQEDGRLVISYYSDTNVEGIKKLLSEQKELALGLISFDKSKEPLQFPSKKEAVAYNLDVYEIQQGQHPVSDLGGTCALELNTKHLRFVNNTFSIPAVDGYPAINDHNLKPNFRFQRYAAIVKEYSSHKIPEVRAGPFS